MKNQNDLLIYLLISEQKMQENMLPQCRICYEGEENLISPCKCSGTSAFVHRECLEKWRKTLPMVIHNNQRDVRCEMCHTFYQFEGDLTYFKYRKCRIAWDIIQVLTYIQLLGFLLGMIITGFGHNTSLIFTKNMNIYLYQYLLGNTITHIIIGIIVIIGLIVLESNNNDNNYVCICSGYCLDTILCFVCIFFILLVGIILTFAGVYYWALEKSKKHQRLQNDNRRIKNINEHQELNEINEINEIIIN
jgi:E3 ubiquitin-protein ligase DOA10